MSEKIIGYTVVTPMPRANLDDIYNQLDEHEQLIENNTIEIDKTLSIEGAAADSKATGDRFTELENKVEELENNTGGSETAIEIDKTLSIEGAAADSKAVGDAFTTMLNAMNNAYDDLKSDLTTLDESAVKTVNGVAPDDAGNVVVEGGGSDIVVDDTFTIQGAAADAKAVGDVLVEAETAISDLASRVQNNTNAIGVLETQASDEHIREIVDEVINEALAGDY